MYGVKEKAPLEVAASKSAKGMENPETEDTTKQIKTQAALFRPAKPGDTFQIEGRAYPVKGFVSNFDGSFSPLVDLPMMSEYKWKLLALETRLKYPEAYAVFEDVEKVIEELRCWLEEYDRKRSEKETFPDS